MSAKSAPSQTAQRVENKATQKRSVGNAVQASERLLAQMDGQMNSIDAMAQRMEQQFNNAQLVSWLFLAFIFFIS